MKRPSFQFYPADWKNNSKLRRCSDAARGAWVDVLCVLHDSDEYGVCRWPLAELARAAGVQIKLIKELVAKNVLKGSDQSAPDYVFTPRHAGKDGAPVVLVVGGNEPCWYCSRFVRDEYIRQRRGQTTRFSSDNQPPSNTDNDIFGSPPKGGFGTRQGDGPTSPSTSPSTSTTKATTPPIPPAVAARVRQAPRTDDDAEFIAAWNSYPKRPGASRADAFKAWSARVREGVKPDDMLAGVRRYADYVTQSGTEPQFVKQPATFFGPGEHYLADWTYSAPRASPKAQPYQTPTEKAKDFADRLTGKKRHEPAFDFIDITPTAPRELGGETVPQDADGLREEVHGPVGRR